MKTNAKTRIRRRTYLINKGFQVKYILSYFILVAVGVLTFSLLFSLFAADTLSMIYDNQPLPIGSTPGLRFDKFLEATWIFIVLGAFIIIVYSIFLTHRIAGPNYRFRRTLESLIDGDFNLHVVLREKDEAQDIADAFNRFIVMHSNKLRTLQHMSDEIGRILDRVSEHPEFIAELASPKASDASRHIEQIQILNQRMTDILHAFKTQSD
ncbi:MAG: chemotaxis protein [Deltaproteobacteria bacterium]|nr:MAG: chemotaxis protein [Deltaproteobacteria bacterium]